MTVLGDLSPIWKQSGVQRTTMHCHSCVEQKLPPNFIAILDFDLNGNHVVECPRCAHIHYRVIQDGVVTEERYNSGYVTHTVERRNVWKSETVPIQTTTAAAYMRDRWLQKGLT